jgi:hypothetical protein
MFKINQICPDCNKGKIRVKGTPELWSDWSSMTVFFSCDNEECDSDFQTHYDPTGTVERMNDDTEVQL